MIIGGWGVGVCMAREFHIAALQVPVPVETLNDHFWLICGVRGLFEKGVQENQVKGRMEDGRGGATGWRGWSHWVRGWNHRVDENGVISRGGYGQSQV